MSEAMIERPAYQTRVIEEAAALSEKLGKLEAYIETSPLTKTDIDMGILIIQRDAMRTYLQVLHYRIQRFG